MGAQYSQASPKYLIWTKTSAKPKKDVRLSAITAFDRIARGKYAYAIHFEIKVRVLNVLAKVYRQVGPGIIMGE